MSLNLWTVFKIVSWWIFSVPVSMLSSYLLTLLLIKLMWSKIIKFEIIYWNGHLKVFIYFRHRIIHEIVPYVIHTVCYTVLSCINLLNISGNLRSSPYIESTLHQYTRGYLSRVCQNTLSLFHLSMYFCWKFQILVILNVTFNLWKWDGTIMIFIISCQSFIYFIF